MSLRNLLTSSPAQALLVCAPAFLLNSCYIGHDFTRVGTVSATPDGQQIRAIDVDVGVAEVRLSQGPLRVTADVWARDGIADEIMPTQRFDDHVQMEVVNGELRIRSVHGDDDEWRFDLELQVPETARLRIANGVGDLTGELDAVDALVAAIGVGDVDLTLGTVSEQLVIGIGVGDAELTLLGGVPTEVAIESGVGDVDLSLPDTIDASIKAAAGLGDVDVKRDLASTAQRSNATVQVETGTGDIRVR